MRFIELFKRSLQLRQHSPGICQIHFAAAARATAAQDLLDRGWGKAPVQIDMTTRANFFDFLRDVGVRARARQEAVLDDQGQCRVEEDVSEID